MIINFLIIIQGTMSLYRIEKEFFKNVTQHQKEKMLEDFELDNNGDILISYTHKGYGGLREYARLLLKTS